MIRRHLVQRKDQVYEEITNYPVPIPACDQQYNHLLEQRTRIDRALTELDQAIHDSLTAKDPAAQIARYIESSRCIEADIAQRIRELLIRAR